MSNEANEAVVSELEYLFEENKKLRAQLADTAAFLDGLAEPLRIAEQFTNPATGPLLAPNAAAHELVLKAAADCRAMARELRGET